MKFSIKDFFNNCDQVGSKLRFWSHLLKKSLEENFIFCAVLKTKIQADNLINHKEVTYQWFQLQATFDCNNDDNQEFWCE